MSRLVSRLLGVTSVIALVISLSACSKEKEPASDGTTAAPPAVTSGTAVAPTAHAPTGATPGSHEDWCEEHQVPESQCTRCNPDLVAAFKATGDWCQEHGLPESQCLACNPDLQIVRPPKPGAK